MNLRHIIQIQRYESIATNFCKPICGVGCITYECNGCDEETVFTLGQLRYASNKNSQLKCKLCSDFKKGFTILEKTDTYHHLECCTCGNKYHRENKTKYFTCYCMLRKKQTEKKLYERLQEMLEEDETLSREELLPNSCHKTDIKFKLNSGIILYIEVDGGSHNAKSQKREDRSQEAFFKEQRNDDEYIFRVDDSIIENDTELEQFVVLLEHLREYELGKRAVYRFKPNHFQNEDI